MLVTLPLTYMQARKKSLLEKHVEEQQQQHVKKRAKTDTVSGGCAEAGGLQQTMCVADKRWQACAGEVWQPALSRALHCCCHGPLRAFMPMEASISSATMTNTLWLCLLFLAGPWANYSWRARRRE